ncbi:DUF1934 family protein [Blautia sp. AF34-10]|nr:DUF1934 family protein [Blautia sp. AF34-10]
MDFIQLITMSWMSMEVQQINFILLSEKEMQMRKSGSFSGQFLFVLDNRTETSYLTPFGKIIFEVKRIL